MALYGVGLVAAAGAAAWFFSESDAPQLSNFQLSRQLVSIEQDGHFSFSGQITDERGLTDAQLECMDGDEMEFIIFIAVQGNDRNRVSFGRIEGSAEWAGRWSGNAYDLQFEGEAVLSETFQPAQCTWFARFKDIVGNRSYTDTGVELTVTD